MFETSAIRNKEKFHSLTFLISVILHVAAIGLITTLTVWDVEMPQREPDQMTSYQIFGGPPLPPPPPIRQGDPDAPKESRKATETIDEEIPKIEQEMLHEETPGDPVEPTDASGETTLPFGDPDGDPRGDRDGTKGGTPGGVGEPGGGPIVDHRIYTPGEGAIAPAVIHRVDPDYPPLLVRMRISGFVHLQCVISNNGQLTDIRVLQSSHPLFEEAALAAVKQWRFRPGTFRGQPVATRFDFKVNFNLER